MKTHSARNRKAIVLQVKEPQEVMGVQLAEALAQCDVLRAELLCAQSACKGAEGRGQPSRWFYVLAQVGILLGYFMAEDWLLK